MPDRSLVLPTRASTILMLATVTLLAALQLGAAPPARAAEGEGTGFIKTDLVTDLDRPPVVQDEHLKNPWGLVHGPNTPWWVADNGSHVSTLYGGAGHKFPTTTPPGPLVVDIPLPHMTLGGSPTGIVFNVVGTGFNVTDKTTKKFGSSHFIFATEDGTIVGWSPGVSGTHAFIAVDKSQIPTKAEGAVYKGLAIAATKTGERLYATNFRAGTVDVFDSGFNPVNSPGAFLDRRVPTGFAPFGIQAVGDRIYVTYAKQKLPDLHDDEKGPGNGFVDVFNTEGKLLKRLLSHGKLNSPWGLVIAPEGFGDLGGDLLVGNFGDGHVNAYNVRSGEFESTLSDPNDTPIFIDGLWGIAFGGGQNAGPAGTLFFTAGIHDEADGLFGTLAPAAESHA